MLLPLSNSLTDWRCPPGQAPVKVGAAIADIPIEAGMGSVEAEEGRHGSMDRWLTPSASREA
jgi:hypothetical protein